ncbi:MAG TPA: peptidoglycan recognition family protein [Telluria sp.]|nr:peptidoglycan recognition family protein [Telluria sp.]
MLTIDKQGRVLNPRVTISIRPNIERGAMLQVRGLIVHQTGGSTRESSLSSYLAPKSNGAHFLIDKDGTILQTASLLKHTWHVGSLRARCLAEYRCTKTELQTLARFNPKAENRMEMKKAVPARYPANHDSIGIELVGAVVTSNGTAPAEKGVYEQVTAEQNKSLGWLVQELKQTFRVPVSEVFRHPDVSRKNPTEAASAKW